MPNALSCATKCVLAIIDMQPTFLKGIHAADDALNRTLFLARMAQLMEVPTIATEQYRDRMGPSHESLSQLVEGKVWDKLCFSASGCEPFMAALRQSGRKQVVLCGIETHICVMQTASQLIDDGYKVFIASDAVSARSEQAHCSGLNRLRQMGVIESHTESIAYEWMRSSEHPKFREALLLVKQASIG